MTPGDLSRRHRSKRSSPVNKQVVLALGAADHRHAELAGDLPAHLGQARARDEEGDAHLRRLDHHLRGQPAGGVENLVAAVEAVQPHLAGDGVDRVVAADVLDEHQDLAAAGGGLASAQPCTAPACL
jgi:hypothetical protein